MDECRQLIWDYVRGEIVCMDNGEVVERIYDYGPAISKRERVEERKRLRRYGYRADMRRLKHRLRKYYRLLKFAKSIMSRGYIVDCDKLFTLERFVFTVYSRRSIEVLDWFEKKGLRPVLDRIISVLSDAEPVAFSRTIRGRYLLAYLVYEFLRGRDPKYDGLDGLQLHIGNATFNHLKKLARIIVNKHRQVLEEAVGNE